MPQIIPSRLAAAALLALAPLVATLATAPTGNRPPRPGVTTRGRGPRRTGG